MIIKSNPIKQYIKIWGIIVVLIVLGYFLLPVVNLDIFPLFVIGLIALGVLLSLIVKVIYDHKKLEISDRDLICMFGVINTRTIRIPYENIDNVKTDRTLLSKLLGLVDVYIDTPGQEMVEVKITDVPYNEYLVFYKELREKMREANVNSRWRGSK